MSTRRHGTRRERRRIRERKGALPFDGDDVELDADNNANDNGLGEERRALIRDALRGWSEGRRS